MTAQASQPVRWRKRAPNVSAMISPGSSSIRAKPFGQLVQLEAFRSCSGMSTRSATSRNARIAEAKRIENLQRDRIEAPSDRIEASSDGRIDLLQNPDMLLREAT